MKLLIDTCNNDLLIMLVLGEKTLDYTHIPSIVKKADVLAEEYEKLLSKNNVQTKDIFEFYVTIGPGSFMGSRVGLLFAKTICQITKAKLYTSNNFIFISCKQDGVYYINISSTKTINAFIMGGEIDYKITNTKEASPINYKDVFENPMKYLKWFVPQKDLVNIVPIYFDNDFEGEI